MDWLMWRAFYIAGICIFWLLYILSGLSSGKDKLSFWGFKRENFTYTLILLLPLVFLSILVSILFSYTDKSLFFTWHIIPVFMLYPLWGIIQQYLMLGIIFHNLIAIFEGKVSRFLIILMVSALFSLMHYPGLFLMAFTFIMEIVLVTVYLRWRNLWAIGIIHGWIATFLLYYVLKRDLWSELFSIF